MRSLKSVNHSLCRRFSSYKPPAADLKTRDFSAINPRLLKFHAQMAKQNPPEKDLVVLPASLLVTFATLAEGLSGTRRRECLKLFGFDDQEILTRHQKSYFIRIMRPRKKHPGVQVTMANSLWLSNQFPLLSSYQELCHRWYCSEIKNVDFSDQGGTVKQINQWASDKTERQIRNIIQECDQDTGLMILNTIFFNGTWKETFYEDLTKVGDFFPT